MLALGNPLWLLMLRSSSYLVLPAWCLFPPPVWVSMRLLTYLVVRLGFTRVDVSVAGGWVAHNTLANESVTKWRVMGPIV